MDLIRETCQACRAGQAAGDNRGDREAQEEREVGIRAVLPIFEDRLTSPRPEAGSWEELSAMLDGAPEWRRELNRWWGDREDWTAFLRWEKGFKAAAASGRFAPFPDIRRRNHQDHLEAKSKAGSQAGHQEVTP
ncbi:MAG: hypothetical protein ACE15F_24590 [bacterium]